MQLCVACAGVPVLYEWCYEHATLSTFACRAGPFSCWLTLAKLEKKISLIQAEGCLYICSCAWLVQVFSRDPWQATVFFVWCLC